MTAPPRPKASFYSSYPNATGFVGSPTSRPPHSHRRSRRLRRPRRPRLLPFLPSSVTAATLAATHMPHLFLYIGAFLFFHSLLPDPPPTSSFHLRPAHSFFPFLLIEPFLPHLLMPVLRASGTPLLLASFCSSSLPLSKPHCFRRSHQCRND